jgi:hypothetical protein
VAFFSCGHTLTVTLAGAAREEKGNGGGGSIVRLPVVDTERVLGLKNEVVCHFEMAVDMVRGGITNSLMQPPTMSAANSKQHTNSLFNSSSLPLSTTGNLIWLPPPPTSLLLLSGTSYHYGQSMSTADKSHSVG